MNGFIVSFLPIGVLVEVLGWYGIPVPAGAGPADVIRIWNDAARRRRSS